ncbi:MAG: aldolase [Alphaproteobacteria bacterium]|nr:aldolase [Alphaproteobacteria bacterium]
MRNDLQQDREDLAAALRYSARLGLNEGICNHFSLAVSESGDEFLVNPQGMHWSEIRASDIVLCHRDGRVLDGAGTVEATAYYIHAPIHAKRPAARAVLHTHMPYATALTIVEDGRLEMVEQGALRFYDRIAYDDGYGGLALDHQEGERIADAMADKPIAFLGHHGVVVTAPTVAKAFDDLYYLERAAQVQTLAKAHGKPFRAIPQQMVEHTARQINQESDLTQVQGHFEAIKRLLDRDESGWRD